MNDLNAANVQGIPKTAWRFYRSNLATIVWDNRGSDKALANFSDGFFTTEDKAVANILRQKGYPEIPLDAAAPPDILVQQAAPVLKTPDVPVLTSIGNIKGEAAESAAAKVMEGVMDIPQPITPGQSIGRVKA